MLCRNMGIGSILNGYPYAPSEGCNLSGRAYTNESRADAILRGQDDILTSMRNNSP